MGKVTNFEDYRSNQEYYDDGSTVRRRSPSYSEYEDDIENLRNASLNGNRSRRKSAYIKINSKAWELITKRVAPVVLAVSIGVGAFGATAVHNFLDNNTYSSQIVELKNNYFEQYVGDYTHRCANPSDGYYYDYNKLADGIKNYGTDYKQNGYSTSEEAIDEAIYFTEQGIDSKQTAIVLERLGYEDSDGKTFTNYLEENGYDDQDDYEDSMHEQISTRLEIKDKNNELNQMLEEHTDSTTIEIAQSIGGK